MAGHENARGNMTLLTSAYTKNRNMGEKSMAFEFKLRFRGYSDLWILVRSAQIPAMGRSDVEDYGPFGLLFVQHGALENSGEVAVTCVETIRGHVVRDLQDIIFNKKYVDIDLELSSESNGGVPMTGQSYQMLDCKLRSEAIDLSTEDTAALIKPSITLRYNWVNPVT